MKVTSFSFASATASAADGDSAAATGVKLGAVANDASVPAAVANELSPTELLPIETVR